MSGKHGWTLLGLGCATAWFVLVPAPAWAAVVVKSVEYVEITAAEAIGVEDRAAFYDATGALRDMVANHLLQLLTLTAM